VNHRLYGAMTGLALVTLLGACERELILPGERFPVRADLAASIPVEGEAAPVAPADRPENQSVDISLPGAVANADWTHRGGNVRHDAPHGVLSAAPQRLWSAAIGAGNSRKNRISAAPVIDGGRIFTMDSKAGVQATSPAGAALWRVDLTAAFDRGGDVSGGGIAAGGGQVFAATGFGELVALDAATGAEQWRQRLDSPVTGAPAVEAGIVYVVGRDGSAWAVRAKDGKVLWTVPGLPANTAMVGSAAPAVGATTVVFPFASGAMTAVLKNTGVRVWDAPVTGQRLGRGYTGIVDITGDPVMQGSVIYAGTAGGRTAAVAASSGKRIWTATEGALGAPLVVGGSAFVVNDEARLVRLDAATGDVIWSVEMPYFDKEKPKRRKAITAHFGPVLAGGRLVVVSSDGQLRLFNPADGALVGGAEIPGGAATAPALAGGVLYVVGGNGQLHAFR
jgi:outer membrane protein assembly factor BamB